MELKNDTLKTIYEFILRYDNHKTYIFSEQEL